MMGYVGKGAEDLAEALRRRNVWYALAMEDIADQYKRTLLGPFWLLVNYLAFAGTFVVIFGHNAAIHDFAAYVAVGLFVWLYLSEVILQSSALFLREENFIKGLTLPLSVYVLRLTAQSLIRAGFAMAGCVAILLIAGTLPTLAWLWSLVAIALIVVATPAAIINFAVCGAYFPDLQFIVTNAMRIGLFLTPIFWADNGGGGLRSAVYLWNPFTYFLEAVRDPIYSGTLPFHAFAVVSLIAAMLWLSALLLLGATRRKIVFVL
ncbi:MAG: ABC transporter permease [Nitratireductor sp.]|nr:ABC transporter permease [Nitratireductor sp.]